MITNIDKFAASLKQAFNKGGIPFDWRLDDKLLHQFAEDFKRCPVLYFACGKYFAYFKIDGRKLEGLKLD